MTVTSRNIDEVLPLARALQEYGTEQLKLHHLRLVGNAVRHPELRVAESSAYDRIRERIRLAKLSIEVVADEDLSEHGAPETRTPDGVVPHEIERIEADPRGALTILPANPSKATAMPSGQAAPGITVPTITVRSPISCAACSRWYASAACSVQSS